MNRMAELVRQGYVLEIWYDDHGGEYRCLASKGRERPEGSTTGGGRTWKGAVEDAVARREGRSVLPGRRRRRTAPAAGASQGSEMVQADTEKSTVPNPVAVDLGAARSRIAAGETCAAVAASMGVTRALLYARLRRNPV